MPKANPKEIVELFLPEGQKQLPKNRRSIEIIILAAWIFLALWIDESNWSFFEEDSWQSIVMVFVTNLPILMCPTLVAYFRHHPKTMAIGVLNVALSPFLIVAVFSRASYARDLFVVWLSDRILA